MLPSVTAGEPTLAEAGELMLPLLSKVNESTSSEAGALMRTPPIMAGKYTSGKLPRTLPSNAGEPSLGKGDEPSPSVPPCLLCTLSETKMCETG